MTIQSIVLDCPIPKIDYTVVDIKDIVMQMSPGTSNSKSVVKKMEINGFGEVSFSERFMTSFLSIFGIPRATFNLFTPEEVTDRIISMGKGDRIRIAVEKHTDGLPHVLSAIKTTKPYVEAFDLWSLLKELKINDSSIKYSNGVVRSEHSPSMYKDASFDLGGDQVVRKFVMDVPLDGWGSPSAYLQLTRLICSNGMIGEAPAFRSFVNLGDNKEIKAGTLVNNPIPTLRKFIEAHNNEEGFHVMSERVKEASSTPASLEEFYKLYKLLSGTAMSSLHRKFEGATNANTDVDKVLQKFIGPSFMKDYGMVSLDQIPFKKRSCVPVDCSVQDIINLASEISTHRASPEQSKRLSAFIGQMISDENGFDLEGHEIKKDQRTDLYLTDPKDAHENDDDKEIN